MSFKVASGNTPESGGLGRECRRIGINTNIGRPEKFPLME